MKFKIFRTSNLTPSDIEINSIGELIELVDKYRNEDAELIIGKGRVWLDDGDYYIEIYDDYRE